MHQEDETFLMGQDGAEMDAASLEHEVSEAFQAFSLHFLDTSNHIKMVDRRKPNKRQKTQTTEAEEYYMKSVSFV